MRSLARAGVTVIAVPLLATTGVLGGASTAYADTAFQVQTAATAVHLVLTQQPASSIITASLVDDAIAYAAGSYDSAGSSDGQAATVYPGNLVVQGPSLLCSQLFSCPVTPPDYPLLADASYPQRPHARAATNQQSLGSGPIVVQPADSVATASATGNTADSMAGGSTLLAGSPATISIGSAVSHHRLSTNGSVLTAHVESVVTDISIAGVLHIGAIDAVDDISLQSGAKPVDSPHITVTGVTLAGTPASIDETGVHVAGQNAPGPNQALAQKNIAVRTVGANRADTPGIVRSQATGLEIDLSLPVSGLPYLPNPLPAPFDQIPGVNGNGTYLAHITLGAVGVVAGANAQPGFSLGGFGLPPAAGTHGVGASGAAAPGGAAGPAAGTIPPDVAGRASTPTGRFGFVLDGVRVDLADLYAVIALGTAALFVGWRGIVGWRRWRVVPGRQA
jgi:hypothetical protein